MKKYTRAYLINICERGIVPEKFWADRDTQSAQKQLAHAWGLLKAGCEFKVVTPENKTRNSHNCVTNERTIWVEITSTDFSGFENGVPNNCTDTFYLPTHARLKENKGRDWY